MKQLFLLLLFLILLSNCSSGSPSTPAPAVEQMYFPPNDRSTIWESKTIASIGWNQNAVQPLLDYLQLKNAKSFMILVNGRIVM
ncbi:MAG: serine hydrolase, partial [Flavobacterium sp.]|nr:serine hydrolase [Flavobacterium sp.]